MYKSSFKHILNTRDRKLKTKAEKLIVQYEQRLRENKSIDINEIGSDDLEKLCKWGLSWK